MPSFWTKIPGVQRDMYKTFFERSEDLPLEVTITIKEKYTDTEIQQLEESLSPDSTRRWKKVTFLCDCICLIMEQREHSDSLSQVLSKFRMLQLPSLETARFVLHRDEFHEYKRQLATELLRYHDDWEAPKLKTLKLEGFIPRFFSKRMDFVTDVTVNIDYMDHEVEYEPFSLAYFLQSVSAVENLKIVLNRPISSEKLYNYLPITYRRISRRLGLTDLDDTSTLVISDHSIQKLVSEAPVPDVTPDSLYKHLLITYRDEDSGRVVDREDHDMELDNQAYASEEWIQRIYLPGECLINLSIYPFVHLAKLKYLEYDLDPLCDIYLIMSVNRMLEIPTVEELVFRLNKVRGKGRHMTGLGYEWNRVYSEHLNCIFQNTLFSTKFDGETMDIMPGLKRLFISVDGIHDDVRSGNYKFKIPFHTIPKLEHLEIDILGLKPCLSGLETIKLETLRLSGLPSYVITPSLAKYVEDIGMLGEDWHPKEVVLNVDRCTCSEIYQTVAQKLFNRLTRTRLKWNNILEPYIPEKRYVINTCQNMSPSLKDVCRKCHLNFM